MLNRHFSQLTDRFLKPGKAVGIEIISQNGQLEYSGVLLEKTKKTVSILKESNSSYELESVISKLAFNIDTPIFLVLNVKGVLHRQSSSSSDDPLVLLRQILPNSNPNEFLIQSSKGVNGNYLSLIRTDQLTEILTVFSQLNLRVLDIHLGPQGVTSLLPLLQYPEKIATQTHVLSFNDGQLVELVPHEEEPKQFFKLGDETLSAHQLPAFAAAFNGLLFEPQANNNSLVHAREDFKHKQLFKVGGWAALTFFLVTLLFSYFVFDHFNSKNMALKGQLAGYQSAILEVDNLRQKVEDQRALFGDTNQSQSRVSFYLDRIAALIPDEIQLSELVVFPIIKKKASDSGTLPEFRHHVIRVKGQSNSSIHFNDWKKSLEDLDWIKSITVEGYKNLDQLLGEFELLIEL